MALVAIPTLLGIQNPYIKFIDIFQSHAGNRSGQWFSQQSLEVSSNEVPGLVNVNKKLWKFFIGKTHYKWPFSIAMLNYQRVNPMKQSIPKFEVYGIG